MAKPKLFLDMDNVLVDTLGVLNTIDMSDESVAKPDQILGIFRDLPPMPGAIDAVNALTEYYELYILSTAPWLNPSSWQDKLIWLQHYFGEDKTNPFYKRVVMAHDKSLARGVGGILIDDRPYHGASEWDDEAADSQWLQFGHEEAFKWDNGLVDLLINISQAYQNSEKLRESIASVLGEKDLIVHGDTEGFTKAPWE
jgi:5'(3')-deoxyribonucleotidase